MPRPTSPRGTHVVQAVWDLLCDMGRWPTVDEVAGRLDRYHDLVLEDALGDVPPGLLTGINSTSALADSQRVGLTLAGAAGAVGAQEELNAFVAAVRLAAAIQRDWVAVPGDSSTAPRLTPDDLVAKLTLPAAGREAFLGRVGALLQAESWGWASASGTPGEQSWSFALSRRVRRFRDVDGIPDYWHRAYPEPSATEGLVSETSATTAQQGEDTTMDSGSTASAPTRVGPRRRVFLVHGRDIAARTALVSLLEAFDLKVVLWREAASHAGGGTPYTGDIVRAGMDLADAVVVLLTPDDVGYVRPAFRQERDGLDDLQPTGQARLNVIFEAGMAMARDRDAVVLVEVGATRGLSDTAGLNVIRLRDDIETRKDFAARLRATGLDVDTEREQWRHAGTFDRPPMPPSELELPGPSTPSDGSTSDAEHAVLRHLAAHFDQPGTHRLNTPFEVPGLEWPRIATVLRDLYRSTPPYFTGVAVSQADYPVVITGLTERGRRAARSGPA